MRQNQYRDRHYKWGNRTFICCKVNSRKWEGYYSDYHAVTYEASTLSELLADAICDADKVVESLNLN